MRNKYTLTYEERYLLGYMKGYRIGQITSAREILTRCLTIKGKEQGFMPTKRIIQKINRETDLDFLHEILFNIMKDKLSVKELEICCDRIFLIPDEEKNTKTLWIKDEDHTS